MNKKTWTVIIAAVLVVTSTVGCEQKRQDVETSKAPEPMTPVEIEPQVDMEPAPPMVRQFDRMAENADLADMNVSDVHFLPNRSILNGTGTMKLQRLAWIIVQYGGQVTLYIEHPEAPLATARKQTVSEFLQACGVPANKAAVTIGLPQSSGIDAEEAINVYNDSRYTPEDEKDSKGLLK